LGIEKLYQERLEDYYDELAHHYSRSDDPEKAIEYLLKAGEKAKRNYANDTAISYYQSVLDILEKHNITCDDWKLEALKGLGEVYFGIGKTKESEELFLKAISLANEMRLAPRQIARLYWWVADILFWQSRYDDMIRYGEEGLKLLGDDTNCVEAILMNDLIADGHFEKGEGKECREYTHKNMEIINQFDYCLELRSVYVVIVEVVGLQDNDLDSAWQWSKELEIRAEKFGDQRALGGVYQHQRLILMSKGDYENALQYSLKSLETFKNIGDKKHMGWMYANSAFIMFILGDVEKSEELSYVALDMLEQVGILESISRQHDLLANILICQNKIDEAIYHEQKALEIRKKVNNPVQIEWAKFWLGYAYMKKGDYDKVIKIFNEFADKVFDFQDGNAQYRLFYALEGLEYVYGSLGKRDDFINFFKDYREKHVELVKELLLQQWYLEPAPISSEYSNIIFTDDLDNEPLDSSWIWLNPLGDCFYKIVDLDNNSSGLEISSANGRDLFGLFWFSQDLFGQNLSAPRFLREITGNFAIQVCVLPPLEGKPQLGGLLIWKDEGNYICFEKGRTDRYGFWFFGYLDKKQLMAGRGYLPDENDEKVYLRLERSGDIFSAYVSADGVNWLTCGKLTMKIDDPIQVGIYAHGMINRTVYCGEYREGSATTFQEFRIYK
jgi:tetratricopeptide (TPR) repeat protein